MINHSKSADDNFEKKVVDGYEEIRHYGEFYDKSTSNNQIGGDENLTTGSRYEVVDCDMERPSSPTIITPESVRRAQGFIATKYTVIERTQ